MGEIRAFEDSHIPEVAALQLKIIRRQPRPPGPALQKYFSDVFLNNPWRSRNMPSLVYLHEGRIVGFLGVIPRPMIMAGKPIYACAASQLMVDKDLYRGLAGLELLRKFFRGPQDLSYTDGGTEAAHAAWTAAGARAAWLYSLEWTRILRPAGFVRSMLDERPGKWRLLGKLMTPASALTDAALSLAPLRMLARPVSEYRSEEATPDQLLETIQEIGFRDVLKPAYDSQSFRWLLEETGKAHSHGTLRSAVVRDGQGSRAGWYVYFAKPRGVSVVMQLGARALHIDRVFQALLQDAWNRGAVALRGQAIPRYLTNFNYQHCTFRHIGSGVLAYSRDKELLGAILRGDAALSRLDGEWWLRFAAEDWD